MSLKGREADDIQIGINFRAVIDDFQLLSVKSGTLIAPVV